MHNHQGYFSTSFFIKIKYNSKNLTQKKSIMSPFTRDYASTLAIQGPEICWLFGFSSNGWKDRMIAALLKVCDLIH